MPGCRTLTAARPTISAKEGDELEIGDADEADAADLLHALPGIGAYFSAATTASKNAEFGITSLPVGLGCALQMTITTRSFGSM